MVPEWRVSIKGQVLLRALGLPGHLQQYSRHLCEGMRWGEGRKAQGDKQHLRGNDQVEMEQRDRKDPYTANTGYSPPVEGTLAMAIKVTLLL